MERWTVTSKTLLLISFCQKQHVMTDFLWMYWGADKIHIKFTILTILKWTIHCHLVHLWYYATITTASFQNITTKGNHVHPFTFPWSLETTSLFCTDLRLVGLPFYTNNYIRSERVLIPRILLTSWWNWVWLFPFLKFVCFISYK